MGVIVAAALASPAQAKGAEGELAPHVHLRTRLELPSDRAFDGDRGTPWQMTSRVRAGVDASVGVVSARVQLQDVRSWGSEVNPATGGEGTTADFSADGFDLHEGWAQVAWPCGLSVRLGRQAIGWHDWRLFAPANWAQQGQAFDALRLRLARETVEAEVLYALLLDRPVDATDTSGRTDDRHLVGLRVGPRPGKDLVLDALGVLRLDGATDETLATFGLYGRGKHGRFGWTGEVYIQRGERGPNTFATWLAGVRGRARLADAPQVDLELGLDLVSGDDDPTDTELRTFELLYGSRHKFLGRLDIYKNLAKDTRDEGLADARVGVSAKPADGVRVALEAHAFASLQAQGDAFHGVELDLEASARPWSMVQLDAGMWIYVPGGFWGDDPSSEVGGYLAVTVDWPPR